MDPHAGLRNALEARKKAALIEVKSLSGWPPSRPGMSMTVAEDGRIYGSLGCDGFDRAAVLDAEIAMQDGEILNRTYVWEEESGSLINVEVRPFGPNDRVPDWAFDIVELLVVGAGPVARALVGLGAAMGYHVRVATLPDSSVGEFDGADEVIVVREPSDVAALRPGSQTYVAICAHDEQFSQPVLRILAEGEAAYVGMMGSRRHTSHIYDELRRAGLDERSIERIYTPIGLDLGAETPEEIALSVLAQIVAIRRAAHLGSKPLSAGETANPSEE